VARTRQRSTNEKRPYPLRQIEIGNVAGDVKDMEAEPRQPIADDTDGEYCLSDDAEAGTEEGLGGQDKSDPGAIKGRDGVAGGRNPSTTDGNPGTPRRNATPPIAKFNILGIIEEIRRA